MLQLILLGTIMDWILSSQMMWKVLWQEFCLTPATVNVTLIGNRFMQIILEWALIPLFIKSDCWLYKKRKFGQRQTWGRRMWRHGDNRIYKPRCLRLPDAEGEPWNRFSLTALRRNQHCQLDLRLLGSRTVRHKVFVIETIQLWSFVIIAQENNTNKGTFS